ncbi:hypothetical protein BH09ACT6_BH09ACT6_25240 [soil metagenome]
MFDKRGAKPKRKRGAATAAAASLLLALTACATSNGASGAGPTGGNLAAPCSTAMTVSYLPSGDASPLALGNQKGFFKNEGIDLTVASTSGGAEGIAGLVSGEFQMAYGSTLPYMQALENGLPLAAVSGAQWQTENQKVASSNGLIFAAPDGPIHSVSDLKGKKIGVNVRGSILEFIATVTLEKAGVSASDVTFVEIPFPSSTDALKAGRVDAIVTGEPFTTIARNAGMKVIADPYLAFENPFNSAIYMSTTSYLQSHPHEVACFQRAIRASLDYAQAHPDEASQVVAQITKIDPGIVAQMGHAYWTADLGMASLGEQADLAAKYKFLKEKPDVSKIFAVPSQ